MTRVRYKICRMSWCPHFRHWPSKCIPDEIFLPDCFQEYQPMRHPIPIQQRISTGLVWSSALAGAAIALAAVSIFLALVSCTTVEHIDFRPCDPTLETSSTSDAESSSTAPAFDCPTIADGMVAFDLPSAGVTRSVYFDGVAEATGLGPAMIGIHGTYEGALNGSGVPNWLGYNPGSDMLSMAIAQHGVMMALVADPAAPARSNNPFPWWPVCSATYGTQCDRTDDFELVQVATTCALEQGLAAPERVVVGGMSAGGILTSLLIEHDLGDITIAGAVSWSGGTPAAFQPTTPTHAATSVFVLHGGTTDVYCGVGQPAGSCSGYEPYHFDAPSELMASQIDDAGNFAFVCNHGGGHNAQMGPQGAEFLAVARADATHPWVGFPFGVDGYGAWPSMSGGTNWMLRFYGDCHNPM